MNGIDVIVWVGGRQRVAVKTKTWNCWVGVAAVGSAGNN